MRRRLVLVAATVAVLLAFSAPVASAVTPDHGTAEFTIPFTFSAPVPCSFDVQSLLHASVTYTDFYDQNGTLVRETGHVWEQDTFSAKGTTLVGDPYRLNYTQGFDSTGAIIFNTGSGWVGKVTLPDGTKFWEAGHVNWFTHPDPTAPSFTPDNGHMGDVAAFCAAF